MGLQLALLSYILVLYKLIHTLNLSLKNGNLDYNLQRQRVYAVCIIVSFLKNNVLESIAPKDDGRDTKLL